MRSVIFCLVTHHLSVVMMHRGGAHLSQHPPAGLARDNRVIKASAGDVPPQNQLSGAEGDDH